MNEYIYEIEEELKKQLLTKIFNRCMYVYDIKQKTSDIKNLTFLEETLENYPNEYLWVSKKRETKTYGHHILLEEFILYFKPIYDFDLGYNPYQE